MNRYAYYQDLKTLARQVRAENGLSTPRVSRSDMRRIYKVHGIRIDLWPYRLRTLRGAYFNDDAGATVMIARGLPPDPMIFTLGHELKHHIVDGELGLSYCDSSNQNQPVEIGAEIFAAELIFPEQDFIDRMNQLRVGKASCTPEVLVQLKRETQTTLSYAALAKRAQFLGFAKPGSLANIRWKKLEEELFGEPIYKRIIRRRIQSAFNS